jgi:hypothetical protein
MLLSSVSSTLSRVVETRGLLDVLSCLWLSFSVVAAVAVDAVDSGFAAMLEGFGWTLREFSQSETHKPNQPSMSQQPCGQEARELGGDGHHDHDHHHEHGHDHHDHDHDLPTDEYGPSLLDHIQLSSVRCLNEATAGSAVKIFKPIRNREDESDFLESDADEELILHVPFNACVRMKFFALSGGANGSCPSNVKIFTNREDIDFDNCNDLPATQEFELAEDLQGRCFYRLNARAFSNITSVTFYFPSNHGSDTTTIYYMDIRGDFMQLLARKAVKTTYESRPQLSDHKARNESSTSHSIS